MAFPTVASSGQSATTTAATSHTVSIGSPTSGQRVIVVFHHATSVITVTFPAGWTEITGFSSTLGGSWVAYYRDCDGAEGASINVTTGATSVKSTHNRHTINAGTFDTGIAPEAGVEVTGTSANPNPPSLSPTGGAKDYLWIAVAGIQGEAAFTGSPTNYLNPLDSNTGTAGAVTVNCVTRTARRDLNAASDDPGTFSHAVSEAWGAQTVVIHPAAAFDPPPRPTIRTFAVTRAATY